MFSSRIYNELRYYGTELIAKLRGVGRELMQSRADVVRIWKSLTPRQWTLGAGLALIGPAFWGFFGGEFGGPWFLRPFPALTEIPAFFVGPLSILLPSALFFLWCPRLFRGQERIPNRSLVLLGILTVLTGISFIEGWNYGMQYQGAALTYSTLAANIVWIILLWFVFLWARHKRSFRTNLLAHFLLFMWLGWQAFPHMGEFL